MYKLTITLFGATQDETTGAKLRSDVTKDVGVGHVRPNVGGNLPAEARAAWPRKARPGAGQVHRPVRRHRRDEKSDVSIY